MRSELESLARENYCPHGGPDEELTEDRPRDRYLVGMLAPKNKLIRAAEMDSLAEDGEGSIEDGATDDSPPAADSLYPSSIGLTCTVNESATAVTCHCRWGRYFAREERHAHDRTGNPRRVEALCYGNVGKKIS